MYETNSLRDNDFQVDYCRIWRGLTELTLEQASASELMELATFPNGFGRLQSHLQSKIIDLLKLYLLKKIKKDDHWHAAMALLKVLRTEYGYLPVFTGPRARISPEEWLMLQCD